MSNNEDTSYVSESPQGKSLLLKVPDYELAATRSADATSWDAGASKKNTFLQLGDGTNVSAVANDPPSGDARNGNDLLVGQIEFVDDTRYRGESGASGDDLENAPRATPPNESTARASGASPFTRFSGGAPQTTAANPAATLAIPDYVGWRDHTDGHRITTTRGDKIEIIGGNYKLVSLGRGTGTATYEMSGGLVVQSDEGPGATSSITWRDCPSAPGEKGWQAVEQFVKGNVVERFHGTKREEFYGDKLISVVGSPDENTSGIDLGNANQNGTITNLWETTSDTLFFSDSKARPTKWDTTGDEPPKLQKPDVHSSTWAQTILDYTRAQTLKEHLHVDGEHVVQATYEGGYEATVRLTSLGKSYTEWWKCGGSLGFYEYFEGAMTQFFFGASTTIGFSNRFEIFVGLEQQLNIGGFVEIKLGADVSLALAAQYGLSAGVKLEVETQSAKFWLAKQDTGLSDLETAVSTMKTTMNQNITTLNQSVTALKKGTVAALHTL
jgi:hypothetical protein